MRIAIPLKAGVPLRQFFRGRCVVLVDTGAADEIDVTLFGSDQQDAESYGGCGRNFSVFAPDKVFSGAELTATVDTTAELIVSGYRVETLDGANLTVKVDGFTPIAPTDRSGTIAAGGTSQVLMAANSNRRGFWVQNPSTTDNLWVSELGAAVAGPPSVKIGPGDLYEAPQGGCAVGALTIIGTTTGQPFAAREF